MSLPARVVEPVRAHADPRWRLLANVDAHLRSRAQALGVETRWSPLVLMAIGCVALSMAGAHLGGLIGGLVATGLTAAGLAVAERQVDRRIERLAENALAEVALRMSRAMRAGDTVERALAELDEMGALLTAGLRRVVRQVGTGRPVEPALAEWLAGARSSPEQLLAAAMAIGVSHGGSLARTLDGVGDGLRDELEHSSRRRILLVQTRMSAAVLVALPVVFAFVVSTMQGRSLFEDAAGLLVSGLLLDAVGLWWMTKTMRRLG